MYEVIVAVENENERKEQTFKRKIVAKDLKNGTQVKAQFYDFREEIREEIEKITSIVNGVVTEVSIIRAIM